MHQKRSESSQTDSVTNCCQEESRSNYSLFNRPLTIMLLTLHSKTAYCGERDQNSEQTPQSQQKNTHFISRARESREAQGKDRGKDRGSPPCTYSLTQSSTKAAQRN